MGQDGGMGDYTARIRAALGGQLAPAATDGGRRVVYRCPACGYPWEMRGAEARLRLAGEELAAIAEELGAQAETETEE